MGTPMVSQNAVILCPHGGKVAVAPTAPRVKLADGFAATIADIYTVSGCPFQLPTTPPTPSPCLEVVWTTAAVKVTAGAPVLLQNSQGLCMGPSGPQGPPSIGNNQVKVEGT